MPLLTILPHNIVTSVSAGTNLLQALRTLDRAPDAPCGGNGKCGKCRVSINGQEQLACTVTVDSDLTVALPHRTAPNVLMGAIAPLAQGDCARSGFLLAFDIGTTTLVCYLLDGSTGRELACAGRGNPQAAFGADVISRIRAALEGALPALTASLRDAMTGLTQTVCREEGISPEEISSVSVVGNPAMQQLFLGLSPKNLAAPPFAPLLTEARTVPCAEYLPACPQAELLIVPDISGYVGADTLGCILATGLHESEALTLLVDIGTNGEMVLGDRHRMIACSTAAGPALEGAGIRFGMHAAHGAIDHVWLEKDKIRCSVIGGGTAAGICGSGLIDAAAVFLELGLLNKRGRILSSEEIDGQRILPLADGVYLNQEDIRQLQLAKGAIRAGISLMAEHMGVQLSDIRRVLLAGAFGSFLNPRSACRIGLLPEELEDRITAVGNAAVSGARLLACEPGALAQTEAILEKCEFLELASLPNFPRAFAKAMNFREATP